MKLVLEQFDSLDAFDRSLERPTNSVFAREECSSHRKGRKNWAGTETWEEAMELFNNGWTEKADEIRRDFVKFERAQERQVSYEKSRPTTSVVGFTPHVPNAVLGLPNSMIHTERQPMKAKVVRIVYNMSMNANTEADDIMRTGLAVLKIAYSLERQGMRVRVDVNPYLAKSGDEKTCLLVSVKDWRQQIDIKKVAFPMAHPSMFRRLGFRWLETTPNLSNSSWTGGYGSQLANAAESKKFLTDELKVLKENDYFVDVTIGQKCNFDVKKIAEEIGIKNL